MRHWVPIALVAAVIAAASWTGNQAGGQAGAGNTGEASIRAALNQYAVALKAGDLKAILSYWAADADFTDEGGKAVKGRDAIGKLFEQNLKEIDDFIADCERHLKEVPQDELAREYLYSAYQQKAELLAAMLDRGRSVN